MSDGRSFSLFLQVLGLIVVQCGTVYTSTVKDDASPSDGTCPVILPWLCNASSLDLSKLCLTFNGDYSRQLCSTSCDGSVYQRLLDHPPSGFGADMSDGRSFSLFLQVGLSYTYKYVRHNGHSGLSALRPNLLCQMYVGITDCYTKYSLAVARFVKQRLLMAGDIEANPGPLTSTQEKQLVDAMLLIPGMNEGQKAMLNELKAIREMQTSFERKLEGLSSRITAIESEMTMVKSLRDEVADIKTANLELDTQLRMTTAQQDEVQNQSRRNNLIFYGLADKANETWEESEAKVITFCSDKLGVKLEPTNIERAHRLGRFSEERGRPLISKFLSFKDKQKILSVAHKLKGSGFSIGEDFSPAIQLSRRKLLEYAREQNAQFKLRYNKLVIRGKTYQYNPDTVVVFETSV
uniref:Putative tick transposon n=1 Tax=Ixodes scapularis TaxID=6945 RepID=A0A4D5RD82_IXOSC